MTTPPNFSQLEENLPLLLGPGPSNVPTRVLQAMASPMMSHLDPYFLEIMDRIQDLLRYVFRTENEIAIPVSGTGSAAMEAALSNMIEPGDPVLVCVKGYFGARMEEMSRRYGADIEVIRKPMGEVFAREEIDEALAARPAKVVAIVHGETSSGALQPMEGLADLVHDKGGLLVVDTVATLGGSPVLVDEWDIDVCYSGSQKGLSCPPGLGPITLGPRAQKALADRKTPVGNWYFDMSGLENYWGKERTYHHTAPISSNLALYEGLRIVAEEGLENRWARHRSAVEMLWEGLRGLDMTMVVPEPYRMVTLTTVAVPDGIDEAAVRSRLQSEYNIEIAGGLGDMKGKVWRIGLMGHSARDQNVRQLLGALDKILHG